jgi:hypothetical protein
MVYCVHCPGQAGVLCTARTGREVRTGRFFVLCKDWQEYVVLYCLLSGLVLSGQASVLCTVRTGRCILYGDRQAYYLYCQDELL